MENMFARTFPTSIKVGENFRFEGNYASQRICEFPNGWWTYDQSGIVYTGKWVSSVDGKTYDASKLPSSVSATYTVLTIEIPSGLTATYGQSLSEVELPEGFSWADSSLSVGFPGTREFDLNWQLDTNHSKLTNLKTTVVVGPAAIDSSMFKLKSAALCYTGEAIEPVVSSDVVPEGSYTVTYRDNVDAGTATAVITGSGYWTGSCEVEFQIARAAASYEPPTGLTATYGHTLADVALPEGFAWDDPTLSVGDAGENGFGLSWAGDANHEGATGLTATVSVTRGVEGSMFSVASDGLAYTGGALEPAVSSDVVPDCSYTVTYRDNVDAGTATAVITGSGYWTGSCEVEFQIARAAASYELPTGLTATAGQKLSDVELPEGFSWDDPSAYIGSTGEYGLSWAGDANHEGATGLKVTVTVETVKVSYRTHVQDYGLQGWVSDGAMSGTSGKAKRLEGIYMKLENADGGIAYSTHVQDIGWQGEKHDGELSGTTGQSKRLEALTVSLTGNIAQTHSVWYRVHAEDYGWLGWARDGEQAGTQGLGKRLEAVEVVVLPKGQVPDGYSESASAFKTKQLTYTAHVQDVGDTSGYVDSLSKVVRLGTTGQGKRIEALSLSLGSGVDGGITYSAHVQDIGWQSARSNGAKAGTSGQGKRLEALTVSLTGNIAQTHSVWYRVHAEDYGWLGWAKDGEQAGTQGLGKRLEAVEVVVLPKGQVPSGYSSSAQAFVKK
jgi:uncharacterized protein YjdB